MGNQCCQNSADKTNEIKSPGYKPVHLGTAEDAKYRAEVEQIWKDYDKSGSGLLEKEEAFAFLKVTLKEVTGNDPT